MTKKVNSKSTKAEMYAEIERLNNEQKAKEVIVVNPEKEIKKKKEKEVIVSAEKTLTGDFDNLMIDLKNNISNEMSEIQKGVDSAKETLKNLNTTIDLKKNEIKELTETEGQILSAYEISQSIQAMRDTAYNDIEKQKEELQKEYDEKEKEHNDRVVSFEEHMQARIKSWDDSITAEDKSIKIRREREDELYKYNTKRDRRIETDKFNDSIQEDRDIFNKEKEIFNEERNILESKKDYIKELENKVAEIPEKIKAAEKSAKGKAEGILTKAHNNDIISLEKDHKLEIAEDKNNIKSLTEKNQSLTIDNEELKTKLDKAYKDSNEVALQAVKAGSNVVVSDGNGKR